MPSKQREQECLGLKHQFPKKTKRGAQLRANRSGQGQKVSLKKTPLDPKLESLSAVVVIERAARAQANSALFKMKLRKSQRPLKPPSDERQGLLQSDSSEEEEDALPQRSTTKKRERRRSSSSSSSNNEITSSPKRASTPNSSGSSAEELPDLPDYTPSRESRLAAEKSGSSSSASNFIPLSQTEGNIFGTVVPAAQRNLRSSQDNPFSSSCSSAIKESSSIRLDSCKVQLFDFDIPPPRLKVQPKTSFPPISSSSSSFSSSSSTTTTTAGGGNNERRKRGRPKKQVSSDSSGSSQTLKKSSEQPSSRESGRLLRIRKHASAFASENDEVPQSSRRKSAKLSEKEEGGVGQSSSKLFSLLSSGSEKKLAESSSGSGKRAGKEEEEEEEEEAENNSNSDSNNNNNNSSSSDAADSSEEEKCDVGGGGEKRRTIDLSSLHKVDREPAATCSLCNLTFTRKFSYNKHLLSLQHQRLVTSHTSENKEMGELEEEGAVGVGEETTAGSEFCPVYPEEELELENKENENIEEIEEEGEEEDMLTVDTCWKSGRAVGLHNFICDNCGERFERKLQLAAHLLSHRESSFPESKIVFEEQAVKFPCSLCPSTFSRRDYLEKHTGQAHSSSSPSSLLPHSCTICSDKFADFESLMEHVDEKHVMVNRPKLALVWDMRREQEEPADLRLKLCNSHSSDDDDEDSSSSDSSLSSDDVVEIDQPSTKRLKTYSSSSSSSQQPKKTVGYWGENNGTRGDSTKKSLLSSSSSSSRSSSCKIPYKKILGWSRLGCGSKIRNTSYSSSSNADNQLTCKDCGKKFLTRQLLIQHAKMVSGLDSHHSCHVCKKKFRWRYLLKRHMNRHTHRNKHAELLRSLKKTAFPSSSACRGKPMSMTSKHPHLQSALLQVGELSLAGESLEQQGKQSLLQNSDEILDSPPTVTEDEEKDRTTSATTTTTMLQPLFVSIPQPLKSDENTCEDNVHEGLDLHSYLSIKDEPSQSSPSQETPSATAGATQSPLLQCPICHKRAFTAERSLHTHLLCHRESSRLLSCEQCEAKCERKSDLDLHRRCHESGAPFSLCYVCFKPFRWKKDMVRHVRRKHPDEHTYLCCYCGSKLPTYEQLNLHISESHAELRSFPCSYCRRRFAQRRYLEDHERRQHGVEVDFDNNENPLYTPSTPTPSAEPQEGFSQQLQLTIDLSSVKMDAH